MLSRTRLAIRSIPSFQPVCSCFGLVDIGDCDASRSRWTCPRLVLSCNRFGIRQRRIVSIGRILVCSRSDSVRSCRPVYVVGRVNHIAVQELNPGQRQKPVFVFAICEFGCTGSDSRLSDCPTFLTHRGLRSKAVEPFAVELRAESHGANVLSSRFWSRRRCFGGNEAE